MGCVFERWTWNLAASHNPAHESVNGPWKFDYCIPISWTSADGIHYNPLSNIYSIQIGPLPHTYIYSMFSGVCFCSKFLWGYNSCYIYGFIKLERGSVDSIDVDQLFILEEGYQWNIASNTFRVDGFCDLQDHSWQILQQYPWNSLVGMR